MSDWEATYEQALDDLQDTAKRLTAAEKEIERLRAENAELRKQAWHDQPLVDWYERRDREVGRELHGVHYETWMRANPKPGAGT
jgi:predicted RNase H-like nuclease (RuvC/YqgF family)